MIIKKSFSSANARRYGKPWGAKISFPDKVRPKYDFIGHFDGGADKGTIYPGDVVMDVNVNDIVAFGQKDYRGNNTNKDFYLVLSDGSLQLISEGTARNLYNDKLIAA